MLQGVKTEVREVGDLFAGGPDAEDAARVLRSIVVEEVVVEEIVVEPAVATGHGRCSLRERGGTSSSVRAGSLAPEPSPAADT
jgi:hypothetical protein